MKNDDRIRCSSCGKPQSQVRKVVAEVPTGPISATNAWISVPRSSVRSFRIPSPRRKACLSVKQKKRDDTPDPARSINLLKPKEAEGFPRLLRHRSGRGEEGPLRRRLQPLQANQVPEKDGRGLEVRERPHARPHRFRQDPARTDARADYRRAFRYCGCHDSD